MEAERSTGPVRSVGRSGAIDAGDRVVIPAYGHGSIADLVPALLEGSIDDPAWLPDGVWDADRIVLLVLDGLGWNQLCERVELAPTLAAMGGHAITSVAPTTTATALTSISTGLAPGEHGVVGYRMSVDGSVLNVLRWSADGRDARKSIPPESIQTHAPFGGQRPPVITRSEFRESGFTRAHLDGVRLSGWRLPSTLVTEIALALGRGEPFVYAYYDGLDKIAHEFGLGVHFDAELRFVDRLVADVLAVLPDDTTLLVTSDHGQVHVGDALITPDPSVMSHVDHQSGEGRFRWLHARPGRARGLLEECQRYTDVAWVADIDRIADEKWFGPVLSDAARSALGDVALVARDAVSFHDPADSGLHPLVARHGSLTADEMYVPLLSGTAHSTRTEA